MKPTVSIDDDIAILAWLEEAMEHASGGGHARLFGYLEAVLEDAVFEMEQELSP